MTEVFNDFSKVIEIVFNNWTALKLAMEHGMAGPPGVAIVKLQGMVDSVNQHFVSGTSEWVDVSDTLSEIMDSEFSTELEDNSSDEVAKHLCELHQMFCSGFYEGLTAAMSALPNQTSILAGLSPPAVQAQVPRCQEQVAAEFPDEDGWTTVRKK